MFPTSWDSQLTRRVCFIHSHPEGENFHLHTSRAWEDVKVTLGASLSSLPLTLFLHCIFSAFIFGLFPYFPWRSTPIFLRPLHLSRSPEDRLIKQGEDWESAQRYFLSTARATSCGILVFPFAGFFIIFYNAHSICWLSFILCNFKLKISTCAGLKIKLPTVKKGTKRNEP